MALVVFTGGARSGKSAAAQELARRRALDGASVVAVVFGSSGEDAEMAERVARIRPIATEAVPRLSRSRTRDSRLAHGRARVAAARRLPGHACRHGHGRGVAERSGRPRTRRTPARDLPSGYADARREPSRRAGPGAVRPTRGHDRGDQRGRRRRRARLRERAPVPRRARPGEPHAREPRRSLVPDACAGGSWT